MDTRDVALDYRQKIYSHVHFSAPWRISYEVHLHTYILRKKHSEHALAFRCCST